MKEKQKLHGRFLSLRRVDVGKTRKDSDRARKRDATLIKHSWNVYTASSNNIKRSIPSRAGMEGGLAYKRMLRNELANETQN